MNNGIRDFYSKIGVDDFYKNYKLTYNNPHAEFIIECLNLVIAQFNIGYYLDLSCGNGVVSEFLQKNNYTEFKGCDPYFYDIYAEKFNKQCFNLSFEEISKLSLPEKFDTIICSYALHLCTKSYLNNLLYQLSLNTKLLVIISPNKTTQINDYFKLVLNTKIGKSHCMVYESLTKF